MSRLAIPSVPTVRFAIIGEPQSKARARVTFKNGKATSYTPRQTARAEDDIAAAYRERAGGLEPSAGATFGLTLSFHCGTRQRRDLDNMTKLILDGLKGVAYADDSQVTELTAQLARGLGKENARTEVEIYETDPAAAGYLTELKPCGNCGGGVRVYPSTRGRAYCSKKCAGEGKRVRPEITCEGCGKKFLGEARRRFCSILCASTAANEFINCPCGVTFRAKKAFGRKFCSQACGVQYKRRRQPAGGTAAASAAV